MVTSGRARAPQESVPWDDVRSRIPEHGPFRWSTELRSLWRHWVWDGQRWTEIPVDGPSRRYVYSMSYGSYGAYELDRKRALFFGGGHRESDRWVPL